MINHIINDPINILSSEKRIIENCSVEINAPINVYGNLVFRNCSITCTSGQILVYGILKIEKCKTCVAEKFLHIMNGGEYLMDLGAFNEGELCCTKGWSIEDGGKFSWIPYYIPVEKRFDDAIITCASKHYNLDQKFTDYSIYDIENLPDIERESWDKARKMGTYLRKKLIDISWHQIKASYPTYWPKRTFEKIEELIIKDGDKGIWANLAEIMGEIIKILYKGALDDEKMYPFKD